MKDQQKTLFGDNVTDVRGSYESRSLARRTDPKTSREAAHELIESGRLSNQCSTVFSALEKHGPCTSAELAFASGLDRHMVARRLPDLAKRQLVRRYDSRTCAVTSRSACVWKVQ